MTITRKQMLDHLEQRLKPVRMAEGGMVRSGRGALGAIYDAARSMFSPGGELNPTGPLIEPTAEGVMGAVDFAGEMLTPGPGIEEGMRRMSSARDSYRDGNYLDAAGNAMTGVLEAGMDIPQLGIFAGAGARTANRVALDQAKELAEAGADRREIWDATGWFKGRDGQWRFEIDDSASRFDASAADAKMPSRLNVAQERFSEQTGLPGFRMLNGRPEDAAAKTEALRWADENLGRLRDEVTGAPLSRVLPHDDLYQAYPDMADIATARETMSGLGGTHNNNRITYGGETLTTKPDNRSVLLHEGQHAIQSREGFGRGGSPAAMATPWEYGPYPPKSFEIAQFVKDSAADAGVTPRQMLQRMELSGSPVVKNVPYLEDVLSMPETTFNRILIEAQNVVDPRDAYRRLAGEVEARNVQTRRDFTPEERRARPPWETQDVPDELQIVRMGSDGPQMSLPMDEASRMARAREMGHSDEPFYRGDKGSAPDEYPSGAHFTRDPNYNAGGFGENREFRLNLNNALLDDKPVTSAQFGRLVEAAQKHDPKLAEQLAELVDRKGQQDWIIGYGKARPNAIVDDVGAEIRFVIDRSAAPETILKEAGFDFVQGKHGLHEVRSLTGQGVRHKDAAFDPEKAGERGIFLGLGGAGLAAPLMYPSSDQHQE